MLDSTATSYGTERPAWGIRVFHCDDSEAFTRLVAFWLSEHDDIEHVGAAHTRRRGARPLPEVSPDVVLLDTLGRPGDDTLLLAVREAAPDARVIVYSGYVRLMQEGARPRRRRVPREGRRGRAADRSDPLGRRAAAASATLTSGPPSMFRHEALLYRGSDGFLAGSLPYIRAGLAADEAILVAVGAPKIRSLRGALGADADRVRFADMAVLGHNPARIIPAWREFARANAGPIRGIGEPIWSGRDATELVECQLHEALLNVVRRPGRLPAAVPVRHRRAQRDVIHEACSHPPARRR